MELSLWFKWYRWGVLYLYLKGLINVRPDYLIDQIDKQLCVIHPSLSKTMDLTQVRLVFWHICLSD